MTAADPIKPPRHPEPKISGFYDDVLNRAEMLAAAQVEGIDEELAILRSRLRESWKADKENAAIVMKGIEAIVRVLAARHRMSDKRLDDLNEAVGTLFGSIASQLEQIAPHPEDEV